MLTCWPRTCRAFQGAACLRWRLETGSRTPGLRQPFERSPKTEGHPQRMAPCNQNGGETGIRTRETTFAVYSLSRRAPSTYSAISPCVVATNNSPRPRWVRVVPDASAVDGSAFVAEGVGFEPTSRCRETVFKTAAFDHSAIPPANLKNLAPPVGKGQQFLSAAERFVVDISQAGV